VELDIPDIDVRLTIDVFMKSNSHSIYESDKSYARPVASVSTSRSAKRKQLTASDNTEFP
jgi:hypothetical protein